MSALDRIGPPPTDYRGRIEWKFIPLDPRLPPRNGHVRIEGDPNLDQIGKAGELVAAMIVQSDPAYYKYMQEVHAAIKADGLQSGPASSPPSR